jgi:molybdopterin-guanine dinucleotide biosynthesis protein A
MGRDKSFALLHGRPLIQHVLERVTPLERPLMLITNQPEGYQQYGVRTFPDVLPGRGSLGGFYTALRLSSSSHVLCVACDMPFLNTSLLNYLGTLSGDCDAVVPIIQGRFQPLHALYSKRCLTPIERALRHEHLRIADCLRDLRVRWVHEDEVRQFDPELDSFANVNTPADLQRAEMKPEDTICNLTP